MEYVTYLLLFAAGTYVGWKIADTIHQNIIADLLRRAGVTPEKLQSVMGELEKEMGMESEVPDSEEGLPRVEIRIEQHGEQLYAFRKDNDQFLGQGATKEALIERMGEKLRNVKLVITPEDGADLLGRGKFSYDTGKKEIIQE